MNIYLDIDGVLLDKDGVLANYTEEFLEFMIENHEVFWLTTHCRGGECDAINHIGAKNKISPKLLTLLQKIKMTDWTTLKTEAIDFSKDFAWIDDYVMEAEKMVLLEKNALPRLHEVSLKDNPNLLANLLKINYDRGSINDECEQEIGLDISFSKEEFELIREGFCSDRGMDERWRFAFYINTLYIMRHWTGWVNYKLRFKEQNGRYFVYESYRTNSIEKRGKKITLFEKNWDGVFVIFLIEKYLLHNNRNFLCDSQEVYGKLKISIDSIHGYNHWKNVEKIGHYLADRNGADKTIISFFAFLHDIGREKELNEPRHGEKSVEIIKKFFKLKLNAAQYEKLLIAISEHDKVDAKSNDITIQTCWDADRLDLPRVGIFPDSKLLYTEIGKSQETFGYFKIRV